MLVAFGHFPFLAWRRGFLFLTLLIAIPAYAFAGDDESPATDIGEVSVEADSGHQSAEDFGAFTTVIRPTEFDRQMKTTADLLSQTVGVDVTSLGGEGNLSTVSIRGSSAEQVAVFLDGMQINTALTGGVDFATIPAGSIDRIEVIRGGASARFGTDAIGGVINIVTKKIGAKRALDLKLTGGSFETLSTSESWREPRKGWGFLMSHSHFSTGGDFTFKSAGVTLGGQPVGQSGTFTRLHNSSISEDVLMKANFDLTDSLHFSVSNDFFWTMRQVPGMEEETTLLYPANPLEADEEMIRNAAHAELKLDRFFVQGLSWKTGIIYILNYDHFTDPSPAIGNPIDVKSVSQAPEAHAQWEHVLNTKPMVLMSTLRYQFRFDTSRNSSPLAGANSMGRHSRGTNALFLEESAGFLGERLFLAPQGRFEAATGRKTHLSYKVSAVGKPVNWLEIKTSAGTSFRYPTFSELYFPDQGYIRGNPDLKDEQSFGIDAGFLIHPEYGSLEFSYFQNWIDNQILFVPVSATTIQPVNTYRVRSQGVEISVTLDPVKYFHLDANYAWLDAHYAGSDRGLPGRPRHKVNVRAEARVKPVTVFGELQFIGSFPVNEANTVRISGHTALNFGSTVKFAKHFFATIEAKDVTNVQIYDARAFPLPRRSFWVTVGVKT